MMMIMWFWNFVLLHFCLDKQRLRWRLCDTKESVNIQIRVLSVVGDFNKRIIVALNEVPSPLNVVDCIQYLSASIQPAWMIESIHIIIQNPINTCLNRKKNCSAIWGFSLMRNRTQYLRNIFFPYLTFKTL